MDVFLQSHEAVDCSVVVVRLSEDDDRWSCQLDTSDLLPIAFKAEPSSGSRRSEHFMDLFLDQSGLSTHDCNVSVVKVPE